MPRGMTLLSSVAALAIAATLTLVWLNLWQQQQRLQQLHQWQQSLLQLKQAQRAFFRQHQQFAMSQQQLIQAGLLSHHLSFADTSDWQFLAQQHELLMRADVHLASPRLLLGEAGAAAAYDWQPPTLTLKVIGYVTP